MYKICNNHGSFEKDQGIVRENNYYGDGWRRRGLVNYLSISSYLWVSVITMGLSKQGVGVPQKKELG